MNVNGSRSVYLLCDNSLKAQRTKLKRILQSYAPDYEYIDTFPAHRQQAVDYYAKIVELRKRELLKHQSPYNNNNTNAFSNPDMVTEEHMHRNRITNSTQIQAQTQSKRGNSDQRNRRNVNNMNMNENMNKNNVQRINPFKDLLEILGELVTKQNQQQFVMSNLSGRITTLEHNRINTDMVIDNQRIFNKLDEMMTGDCQ